jgi:glutaredoxin-like YruB-family protein
MAKNITIYSTPTCHFCHMAKDFFTENNIAFTDYDVQNDLQKRQEMVGKSGGMAVPVFDIDGEIIVGYDKERIASLVGVSA